MTILESDRLRELRRSHERLVVAELARSGPLSRAELIRRSGLSRTTLFAIVADLITAGTLVAAVPATASRRARGRPTQLVTINPRAGTYLGVDIGRAHVHIVIVNAAHEIVARGSTAFPADAAWEDRLARAHGLITTAKDLFARYAERMIIERTRQLHRRIPPRRSSGVSLNVDLDTTLTVIAGNLYRLFAHDLPCRTAPTSPNWTG